MYTGFQDGGSETISSEKKKRTFYKAGKSSEKFDNSVLTEDSPSLSYPAKTIQKSRTQIQIKED